MTDKRWGEWLVSLDHLCVAGGCVYPRFDDGKPLLDDVPFDAEARVQLLKEHRLATLVRFAEENGLAGEQATHWAKLALEQLTTRIKDAHLIGSNVHYNVKGGE